MKKECDTDEGFSGYNIDDDHLTIFKSNKKYKEVKNRIIQRKAFYMYSPALSIIRSEIKPRFENAFNDANERGRIFFIYGDYNTGKSFLVRYSAALCKKYYNHLWIETADGKITHPIIIKNLDANIRSVEGFYTWLLDGLGNPADPKQLKEWEKTKIKLIRLRSKIIETLNAYETRLLILDESQRLLKAGDNLQITNILEAFKDLTTKNYWDELECHNRPYILLCGTPDCIALLRIGRFIQGRVHTHSLKAVPFEEYSLFLGTIYADYVNLGVSSDWDLMVETSKTGQFKVNPGIASLLFDRTKGKAGLTVEIIRDAVKNALEDGYGYPSINYYKEVILEGIKYITQIETDINNEEKIDNNGDNQEKQIRVNIDFDNLICAFGGCPRSKKQYKKPFSLINHYKSEHPEAEIFDKEGNRLDES